MLETHSEFHPHSELITALGGPLKLHTELKKRKPPVVITPQGISMWRRRGVPAWLRTVVAEMLIHAGVVVPRGFTAPQRKSR